MKDYSYHSRLKKAFFATLTLIALCVTLLIPTGQAQAQWHLDNPENIGFSTLYHDHIRGRMLLTGNTLMDCDETGSTRKACLRARQGKGYQRIKPINNDHAMVFIDKDNDDTTYASSSAHIQIPDHATVKKAFLFWAGRTAWIDDDKKKKCEEIAMQQDCDVNPGDFEYSMKIKGPKDNTYTPVNAVNSTDPNVIQPLYKGGREVYQYGADITDFVKKRGSGTYWGADVETFRSPSAKGRRDMFAGWAIAVIYEDPHEKVHDILLDAGQAPIYGASSAETSLEGLATPVTGPVNANIFTLAWEGDLKWKGDDLEIATIGKDPSAQLDYHSLATNGEFYSSKITNNGVNITDRDPSYINNFGVDIRNEPFTGIKNGDTAIKVRAKTSDSTFSKADLIYLHVLGLEVDAQTPVLNPVKSVQNLSHSTNTSQPGDTLEYSISFTNTGNDAAIDTVLRDKIPAGSTYVKDSLRVTYQKDEKSNPVIIENITSDQDDDIGSVVDNNISVHVGEGATATTGGTVPINAKVTVEFHVKVTPEKLGSEDPYIRNTAQVLYKGETTQIQFDGKKSNTVETPVIPPQIDLAITKNGPAVAYSGEKGLEWILTLVNNGPDTAPDATVTDTVPPEFTNVRVVDPTSDCEVNDKTLTCNFTSIKAGQSKGRTIKLQADVPKNISQPLEVINTASVSHDKNKAHDTDPNNQESSVSTKLMPPADVKVEKLYVHSSDDAEIPGRTQTWKINVDNIGQSAADAVTIIDKLPTGLTFVRTPTIEGGSCSVTEQELTCTLDAPMEPDANVTLTVQTKLSESWTQETKLVNHVDVTTTTKEIDNTNNHSNASFIPKKPQADLVLDKKLVSDKLVVSQSGQYELSVTNKGPSTAVNTVVTDVVPEGIHPTKATFDTQQCAIDDQKVTCSLGDIAVGETVKIMLEVNVDDSASGKVVNTASVNSDTDDPNKKDNDSSVSTEIQQLADVVINKKLTSEAIAGKEVTWELSLNNNGPSDAANIIVTDQVSQLVSNVKATSHTLTCEVTNNKVTCKKPRLAKDATETIKISGLLSASAKDTLANTANISTDTDETNTDNNQSTTTTKITRISDIAIVKTVNNKTPHSQDTVKWTLTVTNNGTSDADDVIITDTLAPELSVEGTIKTPKGVTCTLTGQELTCHTGAIKAGKNLTITLPTVIKGKPGTITNTATTKPVNTTDNNPTNNSSTEKTTIQPEKPDTQEPDTVEPQADLVLDKKLVSDKLVV
ncbi:MAG: hypothetical protein Q4P66_07645, partial [Actinomycetaceae bacterium]|nr:hypothetical protein [Actinomycetaceae bacterium]